MSIASWLLVALCLLDWPQFRGANSDGHADGELPVTTWSDTENVIWKIALSGNGWSSPSVVDGRIYLTTAVEANGGLSLRTMALDANDGSTLWDQEVIFIDQVPAIHAKNSHASPTPLVHDGRVYVHFGPYGMACLTADEGKIEWLNRELVYNPVHGNGGSPMLHEGKLVVVCDGSSDPFVAAVDAATGEVAWKTLRSVPARISHSFVTPMIAVVEGKAQVLAPGPEHFAAYDLHTGEELWKVVAPGWSVVPQPTLAHGLVIYNHDYDNPELIAARLGGSGDVTETHVVWRLKRGAPSTPTPVLVGDELYFVSDDGIASCVDARSGEVHWMERLGGNFSASPIFVNGNLLLLDEDGKATWLKASTTYEVLGTNEVPGRTLATPTITGGAMYLRTNESLYKIGASSR